MQKLSRIDCFSRFLMIQFVLGMVLVIGLYAMIDIAPGATPVMANDKAALVAAHAQSVVGITPKALPKSLASTDSFTSFLPLVMHPACPNVLLSGLVYQDLNGNGIRDTAFSLGGLREHPDGYLGAVGPTQEPPVTGAVVRAGGVESTSGEDGRYTLCLPAGTYTTTVEANSYRFRFPSIHEIKDIAEPIKVNLSTETALDFAIGIGPLTLPYRLSEADIFRQGSYVDIDPTYDQVGVYNSYPEDCYWWHCTGDAHRGIDYYAPSGTVVVAAAPGLVSQVTVRPGPQVMVFVQHTEYEGFQTVPDALTQRPDRGLISSYQHLAAAAEGIVPGAFVPRGQPIGYLNEDVHLHFDLRYYISTCSYRCYVDPFRDLFHDQFAYMEHDSRYGYPIWISWGSPGWWTADNKPCFGHD